jgi:hypothetical protein
MSEQNDNSTQTVSLSKILNRFYVPPGCNFTHVSLSKPGGRYNIDACHFNDFMNAYTKALSDGDDLYLAEKNRYIGPLKVDFDFKFAVNKERDDFKHLKTKVIEEIVNVYISMIYENFEIGDNDYEKLTAYVTERKGTNKTKDENEVKEGLHLMFPEIVTTPSVQFIFRTMILGKLQSMFQRINFYLFLVLI